MSFFSQLSQPPHSTPTYSAPPPLPLVYRGNVRPTLTVTAAVLDNPPCTCKRACSRRNGGLSGLRRRLDLTASSAAAALASGVLCVCASAVSSCLTSPRAETLWRTGGACYWGDEVSEKLRRNASVERKEKNRAGTRHRRRGRRGSGER